jgi:hypothetical protein
MVREARRVLTRAAAAAAGLWVLAGVVAAQGPVAAMFSSEKQRDAALAASYLTLDLPPAKAAAFPARVYLGAGDLERAFDRPEFRPDATIVPTNTDLLITAPAPATQRVLIERVQRQPAVMRELEDQIAARRNQPRAATAADPGLLRIGVDTFVAQFGNIPGGAPLPKAACLIATDFAKGGAIDRRELFAQDRLRKGIAACLDALDRGGVQSLTLPLMGAASSGTQANDAQFEGQRILKECRLINSAAGIALGIHDFAPGRRSLREIGVIQWDQEITGMFSVPKDSAAAQAATDAYRIYAEQINQAFRRGLAGEKTTSSEVSGTCTAILSGR